MNYEAIRLLFDRPVARLVLARPERGNEIDLRLLRELGDASEVLAGANDVRVLVIEAEGIDFCRGWAPEIQGSVRPSIDPFASIAAISLPVIAAMTGGVASAGLELALVCDIRIASADARFRMPDLEGGRLPLAGGTQRLPRIVGRGRAMAMLLAGEALDAEAAYRAGLVSKVVPSEALPSEVNSLAERIASRGPLALTYAKEAVARGLDLSLDQALRYETDLTVILQTTEDRAEGVAAFLEGRREPRFKGK